MDVKSFKDRCSMIWKKYKYAILVVIIGIILMVMPAKREEVSHTENNTAAPVQEENIEDRLASILREIEGAGDVQVMLTIAAGEETLFQTDNEITNSEDSNTSRISTVIVTTAQKEETGVIRQINPPVYLGAVVVCQGAQSPSVQLAVIDAVSAVTGLSSDRISVLKMK